MITLCLDSIGMDHVMSESYNKGTILQRNYYRKMTLLKFHGKKKFGSHNMPVLYLNLCYKRVIYIQELSLKLPFRRL